MAKSNIPKVKIITTIPVEYESALKNLSKKNAQPGAVIIREAVITYLNKKIEETISKDVSNAL